MTDQDIINAAIRDPIVIRARSITKADGSVINPTPPDLEAAARTELTAEIQYLRTVEDIHRALTEREDTIDLSTGGTAVDQGVWYTLDDKIGLIIGACIGTTHEPLEMMTSREEFNRWWYQRHSDQDNASDPEVVIQWDRTSQGKPTILISPGVGSDDTLYILHRRRADSFDSSLFHPEDHYVLLLGLKNRMSGGQFQTGYDDALTMLRTRAAPILHRPTAMRRPERVERLACHLRGYYGDSGYSHWPHWYY